MYTPTMLLAILPEILLLTLGVILLVVEPFWKVENRRNAGRQGTIGSSFGVRPLVHMLMLDSLPREAVTLAVDCRQS